MAAEAAAVLPLFLFEGTERTTCVLCCFCLSQFKICVCVSGLLSVSKFSLCQSASMVTKSLSSPADASCQLKKKSGQLCVHILNSHKNPALRHNRNFNITTAQRQYEAIHGSIQINEICSCDQGVCSSRITQNIRPTYLEYLQSCRKMQ